MRNDNQDRIDAYLRGEMNAQEQAIFLREMEHNPSLKGQYLETKAIKGALADRAEKLRLMARWDKEAEMREAFAKRRRRVRRTITAGIAACVIVGVFAISRFLVHVASAPEFPMPSFEKGEVYYRGGDKSIARLDSMIAMKQYDRAIATVDSLIAECDKAVERFAQKDSLTAKDTYRLSVCQDEIYELEWRRINLLVAVGQTQRAREALVKYVGKDGQYRQKAEELLKSM